MKHIIGLRFLENVYDSTSQNGDFTDYETPRFGVYLFVAMGVKYYIFAGIAGEFQKYVFL